jgi:hypothetical protein
LVVYQVEANDRHGLLDMPLGLFLNLGIHIRYWSFLKAVPKIPKIHECQQHFDFELLKVEVPSIELVNDFSNLVLK